MVVQRNYWDSSSDDDSDEDCKVHVITFGNHIQPFLSEDTKVKLEKHSKSELKLDTKGDDGPSSSGKRSQVFKKVAARKSSTGKPIGDIQKATKTKRTSTTGKPIEDIQKVTKRNSTTRKPIEVIQKITTPTRNSRNSTTRTPTEVIKKVTTKNSTDSTTNGTTKKRAAAKPIPSEDTKVKLYKHSKSTDSTTNGTPKKRAAAKPRVQSQSARKRRKTIPKVEVVPETDSSENETENSPEVGAHGELDAEAVPVPEEKVINESGPVDLNMSLEELAEGEGFQLLEPAPNNDKAMESDIDDDPTPSIFAGLEVASDRDWNSFMELKNSELIGQTILIPDGLAFKPVLFTGTETDKQFDEHYPGIFTAFDQRPRGMTVAFINMDPRTVRPYEAAYEILETLFYVTKGEILIKTFNHINNGGNTTSDAVAGVPDDRHYFDPQLVGKDEYVVVPKGIPYSIENWSEFRANVLVVMRKA